MREEMDNPYGPASAARPVPARASAVGGVLWFDERKGWGYIRIFDTSQDIFVHWKELQQTGYKTLASGERVTFDITTDAKGRRTAANVRTATGPR